MHNYPQLTHQVFLHDVLKKLSFVLKNERGVSPKTYPGVVVILVIRNHLAIFSGLIQGSPSAITNHSTEGERKETYVNKVRDSV